MHVPTAEELAAIAIAYLAVTPSGDVAPQATASRWRLAARLPSVSIERARLVARGTSRWNAASRLDD